MAEDAEAKGGTEEAIEAPLRLHDQRLSSVLSVLQERGAHKVLDLGCGEGRLIELLLKAPEFSEITGVEVSSSVLTRAEQRLRLEHLPSRQSARVKPLQGSLTYRDRRLDGYDAAAVVEVVEHLDPPRLAAFERVLFEYARPACVVLTTPNADYNSRLLGLSPGEFRHPDHRFEWSRADFAAWCEGISDRHGYRVEIRPIGPTDRELGPPTQMAVFDL